MEDLAMGFTMELLEGEGIPPERRTEFIEKASQLMQTAAACLEEGVTPWTIVLILDDISKDETVEPEKRIVADLAVAMLHVQVAWEMQDQVDA